MHSRFRPLPPPASAAVAFLVAVLAALLPLSLTAQPAGAPPAVRFSLTLRIEGPGQAATISGTGVANQSGDAMVHLDISAPETHGIDEIIIGDTTYVSIDGGPYQPMPAGAIAGGGGTAAPSNCASAAGLNGGQNPLQVFGPGGPYAGAGSIQDLGAETVSGVTVEHFHIRADLASALTTLQPFLQQVLAVCGLPQNQSPVNPQQLQAALASPEVQAILGGATIDLDIYQDQSTGFSRRLAYTMNVPAGPFRLSLQEDLDPLPAAVPIAPPSGQ